MTEMPTMAEALDRAADLLDKGDMDAFHKLPPALQDQAQMHADMRAAKRRRAEKTAPSTEGTSSW